MNKRALRTGLRVKVTEDVIGLGEREGVVSSLYDVEGYDAWVDVDGYGYNPILFHAREIEPVS